MTAILIILGIVTYLAAAAWTFGYVRGALNDSEDGWESPTPILSAIFWPIAVSLIALKCVMIPADALGFKYQQRQLTKKRKRIEQQEKIRIELKKSEEELEQIYEEMEREEAEAKGIKKRSSGRKASK